jgi:hypothetical protein
MASLERKYRYEVFDGSHMGEMHTCIAAAGPGTGHEKELPALRGFPHWWQ